MSRSYQRRTAADSVRTGSDFDRAAWLIVGAFTLLGVLQLNSYIERSRAEAQAERIITQSVDLIQRGALR